MAIRRAKVGAGLWTDPSALEVAEQLRGPMRTADNVVFHRPGSVQPRPGFGDQTGITARTGSFRPVEIVPYKAQGLIVVQSYDGTDWRLDRLGADTQYSTTTTHVKPPDTTKRGVSQFMEARASLYHTGISGVRKLSVKTTTRYERAGIWQTYQNPLVTLVSSAAASDRVAIDSSSTDNAVAYRWVVRREDELGYVIRSAPSSRLVVVATNSAHANGAYATIGTIYLPTDTIAGDVLELYRTGNSGSGTVDPGEDYFLAGTYKVITADISAGFSPATTWTDDLPDAALGATLYTSSSQLGWAAAKSIPPLGQHLVWWNRCAWLGNITRRKAITVTLNKAVYESGATTRLEGLGLCWIGNGTGDIDSGSPIIQGVTFPGGGLGWDAIKTGQWIAITTPNSGGGSIPAAARIQSIDESGGTITMTENATGSSDPQTFKIGDIFDVDGTEFFCHSAETLASRIFKLDITETDHATRRIDCATSLARCVSVQGALGNIDVYAVKDDQLDGGDATILFITPEPEDTTFTVKCATRPEAWNPDLTGNVTTPDAGHADRIAWSSIDEPEAWPVPNSVSVGSQDYEILALVPLDDALIVFKEDGIFRVSGAPPNGWVVDTLDQSKRLLAPECVCVLDGVCYAWTDRGVYSITEAGVGDEISGPIANQLREHQRLLPLGDTGTKRGFWMEAHPRLGLVILNVATTTSKEVADTGQFVWSRATGAWSTWSRVGDRCSGYDPAEDRMIVGNVTTGAIAAWDLYYERSDEDAAASYRDQVVEGITPSSWQTTTNVVLNNTDLNWLPTVCDVLRAASDGTYHRVTAVVDNTGGTETYELTITPAVVTASGKIDLHQGYSAQMLWQALHLPGHSARWQEIHATLLDGASAYLTSWLLEVGGQGERDSAPADVDMTVSSDVVASRVVRSGVPRAIVRSAHVYPYVKVCTAGVLWRLSDLVLHHTPTSRRVVR